MKKIKSKEKEYMVVYTENVSPNNFIVVFCETLKEAYIIEYSLQNKAWNIKVAKII